MTKPAQWSADRWVAILTVAFTIGLNWGKLVGNGEIQKSDIEKLKTFIETTLPQQYVRQDVYAANRQRDVEAIAEQHTLTQKLYDALNRTLAFQEKTNEPAYIQGQYDRGVRK